MKRLNRETARARVIFSRSTAEHRIAVEDLERVHFFKPPEPIKIVYRPDPRLREALRQTELALAETRELLRAERVNGACRFLAFTSEEGLTAFDELSTRDAMLIEEFVSRHGVANAVSLAAAGLASVQDQSLKSTALAREVNDWIHGIAELARP